MLRVPSILAVALIATYAMCSHAAISCTTTRKTPSDCGSNCVQWLQIPDTVHGVNGEYALCFSWYVTATVVIIEDGYITDDDAASITGIDGRGVTPAQLAGGTNCSAIIDATGNPTPLAQTLASVGYMGALTPRYFSRYSCCESNDCLPNLNVMFQASSQVLLNASLAIALALLSLLMLTM